MITLFSECSIAQKLLLPGKIKKVLSRANEHSLEQRTRNAHDQSEQTLKNMLQSLDTTCNGLKKSLQSLQKVEPSSTVSATQ